MLTTPMEQAYEHFWAWFQDNEKQFFKVVKSKANPKKHFFDKLSPKLAEVKEGLFYLAGMINENTAELVFTADGNIPNIVFIEELVNAAPKIDGWLFTALKQESDIKQINLAMAAYDFNVDTLQFYPNENARYLDEIDLTIVHSDLTETNKSVIHNGVFIFLDNFLGELPFATIIDGIEVVATKEALKELIPIPKLKAYLHWRQKEFIEKYEGIRPSVENDNYVILQAELENGNPLFAVINSDLLKWEAKASHPWILRIEIEYDGQDNNGLPDGEDTLMLLDEIEEALMTDLKESEGYLNIGRQTANNSRLIYFACKDFRKGSKVAFAVKNKYANFFEITYTIYKDKYWRSFNRFQQ